MEVKSIGIDLKALVNGAYSTSNKLFNFRGNVEKSSRDTHAVIYYDGYIIYYTLVHYSVSCALNLTNFPFDHQECQLLMGSWIYPSNEVEIHIDEGGCLTILYEVIYIGHLQ